MDPDLWTSTDGGVLLAAAVLGGGAPRACLGTTHQGESFLEPSWLQVFRWNRFSG